MATIFFDSNCYVHHWTTLQVIRCFSLINRLLINIDTKFETEWRRVGGRLSYKKFALNIRFLFMSCGNITYTKLEGNKGNLIKLIIIDWIEVNEMNENIPIDVMWKDVWFCKSFYWLLVCAQVIKYMVSASYRLIAICK